jgi:predicted metal-dependent hydrolase
VRASAASAPPSAPMTKAEFKAEVAAWAKRIGVQPRELRIRQMRRKWGSCSTEGRVTLNLELLTASADLRREVIVEELLHLQVPNHGKLFRALKRAHLAK